MVGKTFSATLHGINGSVIELEASCEAELPKIQITGLPGEIIKESRARVRACLTQMGFDVPSRFILVHLSPANARKQGSQLDLAIALTILAAEGLIDGRRASTTGFLGELCLDGRIQPVVGAIALIEALEKCEQVSTILVPRANGYEAAILKSRKARLVEHMGEVLDFLRGKRDLPVPDAMEAAGRAIHEGPTIDTVVGQPLAKRALQIAAAGGHHLLLIGPPGVGKSLIAQCAPALLPPLESDELAEIMKNYAHCPSERGSLTLRPFRSPHHTISSAGLLGGGSGVVIPGEVTLAHGGVLFLDEFPEFRKDVIEGLREPLQNGNIQLHRIGHALELPARFTLIAAMNPCPCGLSMHPVRRCVCTREGALSYRKRVSAAILDRMDLGVLLTAPRGDASGANGLTQSEAVPAITRAVAVQRARFGTGPVRSRNGDARMDGKSPGFDLASGEKAWVEKLFAKGELSYRALHKLLRVARTVADLEGADDIRLPHIQEAWALRCPESHGMSLGR